MFKASMFHSAAIKLTGWYLAIIMVLSIGCSGVIYHFSSNELARDTRRQVYFFNNELPTTDFRDFDNLRASQLSDSQARLKTELIVFNLLVLVGGGAASYALARRTLKPIEDSHQAQARFAADASHELRTPLTAMQTEIEVALRDGSLTKAQAVKLLQSNLEEVAKLKSLSEGLLKLASQNGQPTLGQPVALGDVATESIERLAKTAAGKKITITNSTGSVEALGDKQSLVEVLAILLDNAVRYSPVGSKVTVTSGKKDGLASLSVSDQGHGIAATDLPHVFERFYRADASRTKNQAEGYGLGLAIAKKIMEAHKGHIEVRSTSNKGSTFSIYLPAA